MTELLDRQLDAFERGGGVAEPSNRWGGPLDLLCALDHRTRRTAALELIDDAMRWAETTPDARLIVVMAPQEGKSSAVTRAGALWFLERHPTWRVVIASYADRIARRFGRRIRNDIIANGAGASVDLGLRLAADQTAADEWEVTSGGGVYTTGVGGALTSRSAEVLIIDDPIKGRKDADSQIIRDDVWDWWESTASSRLSPGAPVILVLTRWHYDDLAGRLLREQPGVWRVVHIPAEADPELVDPDPLGRQPGEFQQSARGRTLEQWQKRKRDAGDEWDALYQGNPAAPGGQTFEIDKLRYWHPSRDGGELVCGPRTFKLSECMRFVTVDTATSERQSADYTVAIAFAIPVDGSLVVLDIARGRVTQSKQIDLARPLVERWAAQTTYVESTLKGTRLIRGAILEGWDVDDLIADKAKGVRAVPLARQISAERVWMPAEHAVLEEALKELREFPNSRHDDIVDALAYGAAVRMEHFVTPGITKRLSEPPRPDPYAGAVAAAPVDYDRQQW